MHNFISLYLKSSVDHQKDAMDLLDLLEQSGNKFVMFEVATKHFRTKESNLPLLA